MQPAQASVQNWYTKLLSEINSLAEEFGLDDMASSRLKEYILVKSKDQYKAGNKSGIRWARMNPPKHAT